MKYKLIQKANPLEPGTTRKWYASPVKAGTIKNMRVVFTPSPEFKETLQKMHFEKNE